ncbi:TrkA family potassium uptake protein [candidate division WOR-3 bacterium]|nr:TrkA family potassium uptake protein [candidate division WOR-3 bacterium]
MNKYAVIGLGSFGMNIAVSLAKNGHGVVAVDSDKEKIDVIKDRITLAFQADVTNIKVLRDLNIKEFDGVIVSVGPRIETSVLIVQYLKTLDVKNILVKALSDDHYNLLQTIGVKRIVYPEKDEAQRLSFLLSMKNVREYIPFSEEFVLQEVICPLSLTGKTLQKLDIRKKFQILIIGVRNENKDNIIEIPDSQTVLNQGDSLFIIGKKSDSNKFSKMKS